MSQSKEPPPLFDDDNDIFTSAIQGPLGDSGTVHDSTKSDPLLHPIPVEPSNPSNYHTDSIQPSNIVVSPQEDLFESCTQSTFNNVDLKNISLDDETSNDQESDSIPAPLNSSSRSDLHPKSSSHSAFNSTNAPSQVSQPTKPLDPPVLSSSIVGDKADREDGDEFIEIAISDPQKIGDGMASYMAYKVTTKTNIPFFRKKHWGVTRRFSDFLGLHNKLVHKHLHSGVIIPPAPEKDAFASTKIKLGSDKSNDPNFGDFIERRRAALERYMNRTANHGKLRVDPDFREFLEIDAELPKATSTSAMSGAGVWRLFNRVGETVNKMTFKMEESDQWYEDKTLHIESLDAQLRRLHSALENLVSQRRDLAASTGGFAKSAAVLSSVEEHTSLSRAMNQLSEAMEKIHTIHHAQADADFYHLSETTKDYIGLIGAVKEVFHERVKCCQTWQHAESMLLKKRENKAKMELTGHSGKVEQASEEVREWDSKVERCKEEFERISKAIKVEMEHFDLKRLDDFKDMFVKYLEALVTSQMQIVKVWETFLPEAKAIA